MKPIVGMSSPNVPDAESSTQNRFAARVSLTFCARIQLSDVTGIATGRDAPRSTRYAWRGSTTVNPPSSCCTLAEHAEARRIESREVERDVRNGRRKTTKRDRATCDSRATTHTRRQWRIERTRISNEQQIESDVRTWLAPARAKLEVPRDAGAANLDER